MNLLAKVKPELTTIYAILSRSLEIKDVRVQVHLKDKIAIISISLTSVEMRLVVSSNPTTFVKRVKVVSPLKFEWMPLVRTWSGALLCRRNVIPYLKVVDLRI